MIKIILFMLLPVFSLQAAATFKVISAKGEVKYRGPGSLKKEVVTKGMMLEPQGRIQLANGDALVLKTPMGDTIRFKDKTYVYLDKLEGSKEKSNCNIELFVGKVTNKVHKLTPESSFTVKTPVAVVGVRGTEFACRVAESGVTDVLVFTGEVGLKDAEGGGEATPVPAGSAAQVKPDGETTVKEVPGLKKAEESEGKSDAKGEAKGEGKAEGEKGEKGATGDKSEGKAEGGEKQEGAGKGGEPAAGEEEADADEEAASEEAMSGEDEAYDNADSVESPSEEIDYDEMQAALQDEINNTIIDQLQQERDEDAAEQLEAESAGGSIDINFEIENIK